MDRREPHFNVPRQVLDEEAQAISRMEDDGCPLFPGDGDHILPSPERLPLPPHETASLECLLRRLHPIHDLLLRRGFSDAVASRAVDVVLRVGSNALSSGKAARMTSEKRAGWLWKVAFNAARRAATTEPTFVSFKGEPLYWRSESDTDQAVFEALRSEIDKLPPKQKQAIELHGLQQRSFREAARLIGVRTATVEYRYNRGLTRLASAMKDMIQAGRGKKSPAVLDARAC